MLKMFNYHYFLQGNLQNIWAKHCSSKTVNSKMSRMHYTKGNFSIGSGTDNFW